MNRLPPAVRRAVEEAVRIVDGGVQYGALGIDAPPEVGARAAEILQAAVEQAPDDPDLRCLYAAALSLAGRITESREQLGVATEKRRDHFEAVAELDHPSAWRHVFLSPPWSEGAGAPAPLAHGWIDADGGLALVSFRDGAERVISLLGRAPAATARRPSPRDLPVALDYSWRTRTAGPFMAFHAGVGGPEPDDMEVVNGFAFPWPEGEGHRHELLIGAFLRQERTFVVLLDAAGRAVVNRLVRFGASDMDRNRLYLARLATARVRSIDPRDRIATIARYREELPPDAIRGRLAHRMRVGEAPRDADDADPGRAPAPTPAMHVPAATEAGAETRPAAASPGADGAAPARRDAPGAEVGRPAADADAQAALVVAGLWDWIPRERRLAHATPIALGAGALLGAASGPAWSAAPPDAAMIVGGIAGVFAASVALGIVRFAFDRAIHNRLLRLISGSDGTLTADALVRAAARRGRDLLPGWAGARVRRRLLRLLRM